MFIVVPFIKSTAVAIVAEAKLRFGVFFSEKKIVVTVLTVFLSFGLHN